MEAHMALNAKRRAFVREYIKDFNATQAALRAGYAPGSARQQASDLLANPDIRQAIEQHQQKADANAILTLSELQEWWTNLITGQEPNARTADRLKASELLGKSMGSFTDRVEQAGNIQINVKYADD